MAFIAYLLAPASAREITDSRASTCAIAISESERKNSIPVGLLFAVAAVESGRWDKATRRIVAWPWTVTAEGNGQYFGSRDMAIHAVRSLQKRGVTNIDIGCMQINLKYHPKAFDSLKAAFDPALNTAYAAVFLSKLREDKQSWRRAVQFYHSSNLDRQARYGKKVFKIWRGTRVRNIRERLKAHNEIDRLDFQRSRLTERMPKSTLRRLRAFHLSKTDSSVR